MTRTWPCWMVRPKLPGRLIQGTRGGQGLLIIGRGDRAARLYQALLSRNGNSGRLSLRFLTSQTGSLAAGPDQFREFVLRHGISHIVVTEADVDTPPDLLQTLLDCKLRGFRVEHGLEFCERLYGKIWLEALRPQWLVFSAGFSASKVFLRLKRVLDIVLALLLILVTAPLAVLIAVAIRLSSPGLILFCQERVGEQGRVFTLYKFRSMYEEAERETGPAWTQENDGRVTPLGGFLRRFHLDEIPQALNVLAGDLSFVGPRPERPYFVELLKRRIPYYHLRHYVRPGITGWAQVHYGYAASIEDAYEKLQFDLYYLKNMSVLVDLKVLLKTFKRILSGGGR